MLHTLETFQKSYRGSKRLDLKWHEIVAPEIQNTLGATECSRQKWGMFNITSSHDANYPLSAQSSSR